MGETVDQGWCGFAKGLPSLRWAFEFPMLLSRQEIQSRALPGGGVAQPVDLPESAPLRDQFYSKVAGKTAMQVKATWSKLVFSGKGIPPKELGTATDVKRFVAANPNAIGYIEKSAVDASVKVVLSVD
jgi:hypothetical protein